jgi:lysozyme
MQNQTFLLVVLAVSSCASARYATRDSLAPGIFLETRDTPRGEVSLRAVSDAGLRLTKTSEGFVDRLYNDAAGYCTIAYGHLIAKAPCPATAPAEFLSGIDEPRGEALLVSDMAAARQGVTQVVKVELTDGQYAALCDFAYNVGVVNLQHSTLLAAINAQEFERVATQFRRWVFAGGKELPGLKTRRENEIALFFEGLSTPRGTPRADEQVGPVDIRAGE